MHLKIFDKNEKYICNLTNLITAEHEEELNGKDILTFSIDINNQNADKLEKKGRVVYKDRLGNWKEFIIEEIEETHDIENGLIEVYCESSFYETFGDYIDDKKPRNASATLALGIALEPTRWEVGRVDNLGINSCNFYHMSAKEAVHKVAQLWEGEIRTRVIVSGNRITRRYVDLLQTRGYNLGKRYEYSKDLTSIIRTVKSDYVITALYGYGKGEHIEETDGYGRRIDFADVVWSKSKGDPIDKPKGQKWIGTNENRIMWGRNDPSGIKAHVFDKVEFDDIEDPEELLRATWEEYKIRCQPLVTYEGKVIDLKEIEGKSHEGVGLGDTVAVIDKEFNPELRIKSRIVSHRQDLLDPANDEVVLGNFMDDITTSTLENKEHIDNFRGKQGVWDRSSVINNDGTINAQYLENLVKEMNERLNSQGGYVYLSEDGQGLTTYNRPIDQNPTMAIQLLGGAFRIANRRKPNGEFDWRTFGDGDGFIADMIVAGVLQGGKVRFDLTNGTLFIGDSLDDYVLLFDGQDLHLVGNLTTYNKMGNKSIEAEGNSLKVYDWEGNTRSDYVGEVTGRRRRGDPQKPGVLLSHEENTYCGIAIHRPGTYTSYITFDDDNIVRDSNQPITVHTGTAFKSDISLNEKARITGNLSHDRVLFEVSGDANEGFSIKTKKGTSIMRYMYDPNFRWSVRFYQPTTVQNDLFVSGDMHANGSLTASGSKNALVDTENYGKRLINALETAEYYFQDRGSGKTGEDGYCYIYIDDIFSETVNTDVQYHLEIQEYGEGTLRPIERNPRYFVVKGTPNLEFGWTITAKRKGYEYHRLETPVDLEEQDEININYLIEDEEEKQADEELESIVEEELTFDLADYVLGG